VAGYVNNYLGAEITFSHVSLSFLRNFPRMRIEISEIIVHDKEKKAMTIDKFAILFNLRKILSDSLDIERIIIHDAVMNLITDEQGQQTHLFFLQNPKPGATKFLNFLLDHINLTLNTEIERIKGKFWELHNLIIKGELEQDTGAITPELDFHAGILIDTLMAKEMPFYNISCKIFISPDLLKLDSLDVKMPKEGLPSA